MPMDLYSDMTSEERIAAIARVSMKDKEHLKRWLQGTNRTWLVFNALDLVDALKWPEGVDVLMQIIACYRDHRASLDTGRRKVELNPMTGKRFSVPIFKRETLEVEELDRVIRALISQIKERVPEWQVTDAPL